MKKFMIEGFQVILNDENNNSFINNFCQFPQSKKRCLRIYRLLEKITLQEIPLYFPLRLNKWTTTKEPSLFNLNYYYDFDGITKIIQEEELNNKYITLIKPELYYKRCATYPHLKIHFYQITTKGEIEINSMQELIDLMFVNYNVKQFTERRIKILQTELLKVNELIQIPAIPIQLIQYDSKGKLLEFEHFNYSKRWKLEQIMSV